MMLADERVVALAFVLLASVGCAATYHPQAPRVAQADAVGLSLTSLELDKDYFGRRSAVLRVHVQRLPEHTKLHRFAVNDARAPRCEGGLEPAQLDIGGDELVANFDATLWDRLQAAPTRLDIVLANEVGVRTCVTFPLVDGAPDNRWSDPVPINLGVGISGQGFVGTLGDIDGTVTLPIILGYWLGPVRLSLTFAPGVAQCPHGACPSREIQVNNSPYLPFALGAEVGHSAGALRLGLRAGYSAGPARVDSRLDGSYWELLHGPVLTPRLGVSLPDPFAPGLAGGEQLGSFIGLEVPVSYVLDSRGHHALGIGAGLSWVFAL